MAEPILFIAGLGRCGTTMVMRMLDRGGIPVAGPRPSYEDDHMRMMAPLAWRTGWVLEQAGKAVKWIDPQNAPLDWNTWTGGPVSFLLLRRDSEHQAKSSAKLVGMKLSKAGVAEMAQSLRTSQKKVEAYLESAGNVYDAGFEWILKEPVQAAQKLAAICRKELGKELDIEAAAAAVIRRTPWCAPDLAIEEFLLAEENERG